MPLHLVTGPANAGKAGFVLRAIRERAAEAPMLVVPTLYDEFTYRAELSGGGAVFGPEVLRFERLEREMARRAGVPGRVVSGPARSALAEAAIKGAQLDALAPAGSSPGFADALERLLVELGRAAITPDEFTRVLSGWATGTSRAGYARDLAALHRSYHVTLEALERQDPETRALAAITALRDAPERWGETPVWLYGYDDLTPLQLEAVRVLSGPCGADVTVVLTWEDREALASRRVTRDALLGHATGDPVALRPVEAYSAPELSHLERGLFEDDPEPIAAGNAVAVLAAGGERAEAELIALEVIEAGERGVPWGEIAVVFRNPAAHAALIGQVFDEYGIPASIDQSIELGHTALGRGLLGLLKAALVDGAASDLLAYLRSPGVAEPERVDTFEQQLRVTGVTQAAAAIGEWGDELAAVTRIREAHDAGITDLLEALGSELEALFVAPHRGKAPVLAHDELDQAALLQGAREALRGLADLAASDPELVPGPAGIYDALRDLPARLGESAGLDAVQVLDPLALRARRVRVLIVGGLQESEFPQPGRPEAFLSDPMRIELRAIGLPLRVREDVLADERALFYAVVSRPTERLVLAYRTSDEEGQPAVRSLFVDDVLDLFEPMAPRTRELGDVVWALEEAPTERERRRAEAAGENVRAAVIAPLSDSAVLAELSAREGVSAGALEAWNACPVRWFVEHHLRADSFSAEEEPLARGNAVHGLMHAVLVALREATGSARVRPDTLAQARRILAEEIRRRETRLLEHVRPARRRAAIRRMQGDLQRYLDRLAELDMELEPTFFEQKFGKEGDEWPGLPITDAVVLQGRIDRVDLSPSGDAAVVVDYKGSSAPSGQKWVSDGDLQVALYMRAVEHALQAQGTQVIGGLYQPISSMQRARGYGLLGTPVDVDLVGKDKTDAETLDEALTGVMKAAREAVDAMAKGELVPRPATCHWKKGEGCMHPGVCRSGTL